MLTPAQAAFLAGLPQRPSGYNPFRNRDHGDRAPAHGAAADGGGRSADGRAGAEARDERLRFARATVAVPRAALRRDGAGRAPANAGRRAIETTLDAALQARHRRHHPQPSRGARSPRRRQRRRRRARQRARRVARVGGIGRLRRTPSTAARSTAPITPRQPGSALKPFTYALAFESGVHAGQRAADVPSHFPDCRAGRRSTARATTTGATAARCSRARALAGSENVPAVALASRARRADAPALPRRAPVSRRSIGRRRTTVSA